MHIHTYIHTTGTVVRILWYTDMSKTAFCCSSSRRYSTVQLYKGSPWVLGPRHDVIIHHVCVCVCVCVCACLLPQACMLNAHETYATTSMAKDLLPCLPVCLSACLPACLPKAVGMALLIETPNGKAETKRDRNRKHQFPFAMLQKCISRRH
jgi:hypothetical protein